MILPICSLFNSKPVSNDQCCMLMRQMNQIPRPESGVPALLETAVKFEISFRLAIACSSVSIYIYICGQLQYEWNCDKDADLVHRLSRNLERWSASQSAYMIRNTSTKQNVAGLDVAESIVGGTPEFGVGGAVAPSKEEAGRDADPCESSEEHGER
jgi:hypothetical protein